MEGFRMKRTTLITLLVMTFMIIGTINVQPISLDHTNDLLNTEAPERIVSTSGFDSDNFTVELVSPAVNVTQSDTFDITLNITSDTNPFNITLFVNGDIYSAYNESSYSEGIHPFTIDSTLLAEGLVNFTFLCEENSTGTDQKQTLELSYEVDNIIIDLVSPAVNSTQSESFDITLDITSDTSSVNITLFVDGHIYSDYNYTSILTGVQAFTIDSDILSEGLLNFTFLVEVNSSGIIRKQTLELSYNIDNIFAVVIAPVIGSKVSDIFNITLDITTDTSPLNITLSIEGVLYTDYNMTSIGDGLQNITVNTTMLDEGMLNFVFLFEDTISGVYRSDTLETSFYVDNQYDGITAEMKSPGVESTVVGTFNMTLELITDLRPVNLTLFIEDEIYPDYNLTLFNEGIHNITVDTTLLADGLLNFTFIIEDNSPGAGGYIAYEVSYNIDNHGVPKIVILSPTNTENITGVTEFSTNITSDYTNVYLNVTVGGDLVDDYAPIYIPTGIFNFTINGSEYENGLYTIEVTVYTEEGLLDSDSIIDIEFLDHIQFIVTGLTNFDTIAGTVDFEISSETPQSEFELSLYVDGILSDQLDGVTVDAGTGIVSLDTTYYSEGEHNFTFIADDTFGHTWETTLTLIVDNHGIPTIQFITPDEEIIFGYASFLVDIESTWDNVTLTVYVDDIAMVDLTNVSVLVGEYTFNIDTNNFTKAEHEVKVIVTTEEGESSEISQIFGFANLKVEEIASLAFLLFLAIFIPLYRKKNGQPIMGILIMDLIFAAVTVGLFLVLGVTSWIYAIWHLNLASIWLLGSILVFANWVFPLLSPEAEE